MDCDICKKEYDECLTWLLCNEHELMFCSKECQKSHNEEYHSIFDEALEGSLGTGNRGGAKRAKLNILRFRGGS